MGTAHAIEPGASADFVQFSVNANPARLFPSRHSFTRGRSRVMQFGPLNHGEPGQGMIDESYR